MPRIQTVAMNEAARMVEEGVASAEEIDKAVKYGFGLRFAVLGLLEFIDWGGGDILYYASRYLTKALDNERYAAPEIVERNMREGHIGMKTGRGFLDYDKIDLESHRHQTIRLGGMVIRARRPGRRGPGHALQRLAVRPGVRIGERPPGQQLPDLVPQRRVRLRSHRRGACLRVHRELGQQAHERV